MACGLNHSSGRLAQVTQPIPHPGRILPWTAKASASTVNSPLLTKREMSFSFPVPWEIKARSLFPDSSSACWRLAKLVSRWYGGGRRPGWRPWSSKPTVFLLGVAHNRLEINNLYGVLFHLFTGLFCEKNRIAGGFNNVKVSFLVIER
jgi:hypothetical protein